MATPPSSRNKMEKLRNERVNEGSVEKRRTETPQKYLRLGMPRAWGGEARPASSRYALRARGEGRRLRLRGVRVVRPDIAISGASCSRLSPACRSRMRARTGPCFTVRRPVGGPRSQGQRRAPNPLSAGHFSANLRPMVNLWSGSKRWGVARPCRAQGTFSGSDGRRCDERRWLRLDHAVLYAEGGEATFAKLRLRCRAHDLHTVQVYFGREYVRGATKRARECCAGERVARHAARHRQWGCSGRGEVQLQP